MIFVTDAHVAPRLGNVDAFFEMLSLLAQTQEDVVFMGDIFDLWIGLKRYEGPEHRRFVAWCRTERVRRRIGFVEGNHEFFVVQRHRDAFTWSDGAELQPAETGILVVHGDLINRNDLNYLRFRKWSKTQAVRALVWLLPFGATLVERLKKKLKKTNKAFRIHLPEDELAAFAAARLEPGVRRILVGHFHHEYVVAGATGGCLNVLPDWYATGKVAHYREADDHLAILSWEALAGLAVPVP